MSDGESSDKDTRPSRRLLRRNRKAGLPFMPWGLIPVLGLIAIYLFAAFPFANSVIERKSLQATEHVLADKAADWATATASGQWITLSGRAPNAEAVQEMIQAIDAATSRSRIGFRARPVTRIFDDTGTAPVIPTLTISPQQTPIRHVFTYSLENGILQLQGDVPDSKTESAIVEAAMRRVDPPRVVEVRSALTVTGNTAPVGFAATALRGINTLSRCDTGSAEFEGSAFTLSCEAPRGRLSEIKRLADAPLEHGRHGRIDIFTKAAINACDQAMLTLLSEAKIEFESSSAEINAQSDELLMQVSRAAIKCPGTLLITGHTDASGQGDDHIQLSEERANATRQALILRGVAPNRLVTQGFGADRPVASNGTPVGRARNRRIEISVTRSAP